MIVCTCSFTDKGSLVEKKLSEFGSGFQVLNKPQNQNLKQWVSDCFEKYLPLVFVGAAGIAVRTIAPFISDKLSDSPVIVIDEQARFVIPVLSGHAGGANELARLVAEKIGALPIITTATDIENKFSVDVFAVKNGLKILNKEGIRIVSGKILKGQRIRVWLEEGISFSNFNIPEEIEIVQDKNAKSSDVCIFLNSPSEKLPAGSLYLKAKPFCLGMGCKKGKSFEELRDFIQTFLPENIRENICSVSSINLKKNETGLNVLSQYLHVPFITYSKEELEKAVLKEGSFSESDFVKETTGISNVCERSAVLSSGNNTSLTVKKVSRDGMTLSVSERKIILDNWR